MEDKNALVDSIMDTLSMRSCWSGLTHLLDEARKTPGDYVYVGRSTCPTPDVQAHRDLRDVPHEHSETDAVIKLGNGSRIVFVDPAHLDQLRGLNVDGVVREGFMDPTADSLRAELDVITPTLIVRKGWLVLARGGRHMRVR